MLRGISVMPLPDEELGSILVRACRTTGLSLYRFAHWYLGLPPKRGIHACDNLIPALSLLAHRPPLGILLAHTLVPYATAFLPPDSAEPIHTALLDNTSPTLLPWLGRVIPRWCPECLREDQRTHGIPYWHRAHCLPAVESCHLHGEQLLTPEGLKPAPERANRALVFRGPQYLPGERPGQTVRELTPTSVRQAFSIASARALSHSGMLPPLPLEPRLLERVLGRPLVRRAGGYVTDEALQMRTTLLVLSQVAELAIRTSGGGVQLELFTQKNS